MISTFHSVQKKKGSQIIDIVGSSKSEKNMAQLFPNDAFTLFFLPIIISETFPFLTWYLRFHFDSIGCLLNVGFVEEHTHFQYPRILPRESRKEQDWKSPLAEGCYLKPSIWNWGLVRLNYPYHNSRVTKGNGALNLTWENEIRDFLWDDTLCPLAQSDWSNELRSSSSEMGQVGISDNVEFTCKYLVASVTFHVILKEWGSDLIG